MGKPKSKVVNAIVPGPLEQYAPGFRSWLLEQGYAPLTTVPQLQLMAHVSRWLQREGLTLAGLTASAAGRFLGAHRAAGYRQPKTATGLRPLLSYLGGLGLLPAEPPGPPPDAAATVISEFREYLRTERGLATMTVAAYSSRAARFLACYAPDGDPGVIMPGDVTSAVLADASGLSAGAGQHLACALRAFLRYCHVRGLVTADVSAAAMAVTGRRTTMLPRGLEHGQVTALLAACDRGEPDGRRDYAVIMLLARLGLRAGEAARLRLDDISWRAAQIGVRGKGGRYDILPLPADAGAAIAAWLRDGRTAVPFREVFTTVIAPTRPLTREAVGFIVRRACARAAIEPFGPHRLRHTAACAMIGAKVPIRGTMLCQQPVLAAFREACTAAGIHGRPRIHDLRHSLAVTTLLDWYRSGEDVDAQMPALSGYQPRGHLLVHLGRPRADAARRRPRRREGTVVSDLAPVLQEFFTRRLISQRDASPATIAAYRDTFRLLLGFAAARAGKAPSALSLADLDAPVITAFLEHLQTARGNSVRTRNARLAAIRSLFAYAALRHPEHGALIQRVLAIPGKRRDRTSVTYLTADEADAMLAACDQATRTGRRDHAMLALAVQSGLRVSELTSLTCADIRLQAGPHVHCTGKGRKERDTPLLPATVRILKTWLAERGGQPGDQLFPGPSGQRLSRDAVERRIKLYYARAAAGCPSLAAKHVTVHTLRHTAAMRLLLAGVDITVIALWLGHESISSTHEYLHASMQQKQEAIDKTAPPGSRQKRYQPPDPLLEFLENL